jgi:hypothetical protein
LGLGPIPNPHLNMIYFFNILKIKIKVRIETSFSLLIIDQIEKIINLIKISTLVKKRVFLIIKKKIF